MLLLATVERFLYAAHSKIVQHSGFQTGYAPASPLQCGTHITDCTVHYSFFQQICFALNPTLGEQPGEEFNSGRSFVVPNELGPFIRTGVRCFQCPVEHGAVRNLKC